MMIYQDEKFYSLCFHKEDYQISVLINNLGQKTLADTMQKINDYLLNEIK